MYKIGLLFFVLIMTIECHPGEAQQTENKSTPVNEKLGKDASIPGENDKSKNNNQPEYKPILYFFEDITPVSRRRQPKPGTTAGPVCALEREKLVSLCEKLIHDVQYLRDNKFKIIKNGAPGPLTKYDLKDFNPLQEVTLLGCTCPSDPIMYLSQGFSPVGSEPVRIIVRKGTPVA